jgi:hypothetical protein
MYALCYANWYTDAVLQLEQLQITLENQAVSLKQDAKQ